MKMNGEEYLIDSSANVLAAPRLMMVLVGAARTPAALVRKRNAVIFVKCILYGS